MNVVSSGPVFSRVPIRSSPSRSGMTVCGRPSRLDLDLGVRRSDLPVAGLESLLERVHEQPDPVLRRLDGPGLGERAVGAAEPLLSQPGTFLLPLSVCANSAAESFEPLWTAMPDGARASQRTTARLPAARCRRRIGCSSRRAGGAGRSTLAGSSRVRGGSPPEVMPAWVRVPRLRVSGRRRRRAGDAPWPRPRARPCSSAASAPPRWTPPSATPSTCRPATPRRTGATR